MNHGMSLQNMLQEVVRQSEVKRDFVADTKEHMAMVPMPPEVVDENTTRFKDGVALVLHKEDANALERFDISENCHRQIASRLKIPMKYYFRLLADHTDLVMENVNALFKREPALRMVRTLDGIARAFLSNQYLRIDNDQVLEAMLPVIKNEYPTQLLSSHVDDNRMYLKCLFTGDEHKVEIGKTRTGEPDIVRPGFTMGNSETGRGKTNIGGFFYRDFCLNGCVYGMEHTMQYERRHVGSRLGVTDDMVLSDNTRRLEDEILISAARDVITNLASPEFTQELGRRFRWMKETTQVKSAQASVEAVCKELTMTEAESASVLESFIRDQDYSQWGMVNAVTQVANDTDDYNRASKIESFGNKLINLSFRQWNQIAALEPVAA